MNLFEVGDIVKTNVYGYKYKILNIRRTDQGGVFNPSGYQYQVEFIDTGSNFGLYWYNESLFELVKIYDYPLSDDFLEL